MPVTYDFNCYDVYNFDTHSFENFSDYEKCTYILRLSINGHLKSRAKRENLSMEPEEAYTEFKDWSEKKFKEVLKRDVCSKDYRIHSFDLPYSECQMEFWYIQCDGYIRATILTMNC